MLKKLVEKIELQSILVLVVTLIAGYSFLRMGNTFDSPSGWLGVVTISMGLLFCTSSFYTNQLKESYNAIIANYEAMVSTLRLNRKEVVGKQNATGNSEQGLPRKVNGYTPMEVTPTTTDGE